jgi:hypothetical protein
VKTFAVAVLACIAWTSVCSAGEPIYSPGDELLLPAGWQEPQFLPRRFRNHCRFDVTHGRYYCSDHCGANYQFHYCSRMSFGCCHIGVGYCDWDGLLRCRP